MNISHDVECGTLEQKQDPLGMTDTDFSTGSCRDCVFLNRSPSHAAATADSERARVHNWLLLPSRHLPNGAGTGGGGRWWRRWRRWWWQAAPRPPATQAHTLTNTLCVLLDY